MNRFIVDLHPLEGDQQADCKGCTYSCTTVLNYMKWMQMICVASSTALTLSLLLLHLCMMNVIATNELVICVVSLTS